MSGPVGDGRSRREARELVQSTGPYIGHVHCAALHCLLFLALLLSCPCSAQGTTADFPLVAAVEVSARSRSSARPFPVGGAVDEEVLACDLSFASFDRQFLLFSARTLSHRCPPSCLSLLPSTLSPPPLLNDRPLDLHHSTPVLPSPTPLPVFGSHPYHGNSSICLSAIHSGVVAEAVGGSVFVARFYRHEWGEAASIFPGASANASLSSAVLSQQVPPQWNPQPATAVSYSYTVRGRGEVVVQRRRAPFPPRSDHLHATFPPSALGLTLNNLLESHLIMGGYNGTDYLNDVSARSHRHSDSQQPHSPRVRRMGDGETRMDGDRYWSLSR